jgi:hypothetical protein
VEIGAIKEVPQGSLKITVKKMVPRVNILVGTLFVTDISRGIYCITRISTRSLFPSN